MGRKERKNGGGGENETAAPKEEEREEKRQKSRNRNRVKETKNLSTEGLLSDLVPSGSYNKNGINWGRGL